MCEILNDYFGSVFTSADLVNELPEVRCNFNEDNDHILSGIAITQDIIRNKLSKLKMNKVLGADGNIPRILVENADADILSEPPLYIYYRRLMFKVKFFRIVSVIYDWIKDWLEGRKQRVVLKDSKWTKVISGVPQRSVLGSLLFLIYINDLDDYVCSKELKYADDT